MDESHVVWSVAGSDPSGGAGIQADLKTFQGLGVYGCAALTSIIAQNSTGVKRVVPVAAELMEQQLAALAEDVPPKAIKIGLVPTTALARAIADFVRSMNVPVVFDPVLIAGSGHALANENTTPALKQYLLPVTTVLTPNLLEAENLTDLPVRSCEDMIRAAQALREMGPRAVLLKGGHLPRYAAYDLWFTDRATWLYSPRTPDISFHGTGCTLSSALAASLAHGFTPLDAAVVAKAYINQGMRLAPCVGKGRRPLYHGAWPANAQDLPLCLADPVQSTPVQPFPECGTTPLGFYLIVPRAVDIERYAPVGVRTFQLRAKDLTGEALNREVALAVAIAKRFGVRLFINDAAALALMHGAYGVHLGQTDLQSVDVKALRNAGVRLGVSVSTWSDLARAAALRPSYVAIGAVFATGSKQIVTPPLGLEGLRRLVSMAPVPVVAIGGITLDRARDVVMTGVNGIAVISDVHNATDPLARAQDWQRTWETLWQARHTLQGHPAPST